MKRLVILLLLLLMLSPCCMAEGIDLSGLSFEDLVSLREHVNAAIWQCDDWQEVTVPEGVWKVGDSIPAGSWTVKCAGAKEQIQISFGEGLDDSGQHISFAGRYSGYIRINNPSGYLYKEGDTTEYTFTVENGDYIVIQFGAAVFMPSLGSPDFGFRK